MGQEPFTGTVSLNDTDAPALVRLRVIGDPLSVGRPCRRAVGTASANRLDHALAAQIIKNGISFCHGLLEMADGIGIKPFDAAGFVWVVHQDDIDPISIQALEALFK